MNPEAPSYWTAEANVVSERPFGPGGAEMRPASKHFAPGAKVYIIDWFPGTCSRVVVVGLNRKTKRMMKLVVAVELLENFRAKVCYVPAVIAKIEEHSQTGASSQLDKTLAETLCAVLPLWKAEALSKLPL
jgi:hypothetical protein